ncbi:MAG: ATP-dependent helicase, partial [Deltaproteobacteria bacterium]|nr:ATP-dependent helicase [Deltaproteobacteria bacterium]
MKQALNAVYMPNGSLELEWTNAQGAEDKSSSLFQKEIYRRFSSYDDSWLLFLGFCDPRVRLSPSLEFLREFASFFTEKLSKTPDLEVLRDKVQIPIEAEDIRDRLDRAPLVAGSEYLRAELLEDFWSRLNRAFCRAIQTYEGAVEDFIRGYNPDVHLVGRVFFHLVENKSADFPFAFMATYSTRLNQKGRSKHLPLKHALEEYGNDDKKLLELLSTVYRAAKQSSLVADLLETGELFHPLAWTAKEAFSFLKEIPLYEEAGILCRIPNWWKGNTSRMRLNFSVGDSRPSFVGMDAILNFKPQLFLGDIRITEREARRLLDESEGLAFIKGKWVSVDPEKLRQTLDAYEKAKRLMEKEGLSLKEALRLELAPEKLLDAEETEIEAHVSHGKWLNSVLGKLLNPDRITSVSPGRGFRAELREYQQRGLNWLSFLHSLQFGACLADDMGLGKTVQALAFLCA